MGHIWRAIWPAVTIMAVYISISLFDIWFLLPSIAQPLALMAALLLSYLISRYALTKPNWGWVNDFGAKYFIILILISSIAFAHDQWLNRAFNAFKINFYQPVSTVKISAWLAPPNYTDEGHISLAKELSFAELSKQSQNLTVVEGSVVKFSILGDVRVPRITQNGNKIAFPPPIDDSYEQTVELSQSGELELNFGANHIMRWTVDVKVDQPPVVSFSFVPKALPNNMLEVGYLVEDDYKLAKINFHFRKAGEENEDKKFSQQLVISSNKKRIEGTKELDLNTNRWAGTMVLGWLSVEDAIGQINNSETLQFKLPQKYFSNPTAKNIINIRKSLLLEPTPKEVLGQRLKLLSENKAEINNDYVVYMALRTAYWRLSLSPSSDINIIAALLWDAAVRLEESTGDSFSSN